MTESIHSNDETGLYPFEPPYTYDDPRLVYDEHCFFYDGGYDLVCLYGEIPLPNRGGVGGGIIGGKQKKSYPQEDFVEYIFKTKITHVNDEKLFGEEKKTVYKVPQNNSVQFQVNNIKVTIKSPKIVTEIVKNAKMNSKLKQHVSSSLHFSNPNQIKVTSRIFKDND